jgi:hypothetical protein
MIEFKDTFSYWALKISYKTTSFSLLASSGSVPVVTNDICNSFISLLCSAFTSIALSLGNTNSDSLSMSSIAPAGEVEFYKGKDIN